MSGERYTAKPLDHVMWTMTPEGRWATWDKRKLAIVDVYESREMAEAWAAGANQRAAARAAA